MTREKDIEQRLVNLATKHNFIAWKWQSTRRGVVDRVVIANGQVVFVELKAPNEKPTKQQMHVHELMRAQGAEVHVIDSLEGVDELVVRLTAYAADTREVAGLKIEGVKGLIDGMFNAGQMVLDAKSLQMKAHLDIKETKA